MEAVSVDLLKTATTEENLITIHTLSGLAWIATNRDQPNPATQELIADAFALINAECEQIIRRLNQDSPH